MTIAQLAAFAAATTGVFGAWYGAVWLQRSGGNGALAKIAGAVGSGDATISERRRLVTVVAATLAAGGWLLGGVLLAALSALCAPVAVGVWATNRRHMMSKQLAHDMPAAARSIADALTAGHTLTAALKQASASTGGAAGGELRRVADLTELGLPVESALLAMRGSAADRAWESMGTAILIQREVGGDLAGLLRVLAGAAEAGSRAEAAARAALAQARATAQLIAGLPVLALLGIAALDRATIGAIATQPIALALLVTGLVFGAAAIAVLLKLARLVDLT